MVDKQRDYRRWNLIISGATCLVAAIVVVPLVAGVSGWRFFAGMTMFVFIAILGFWSTRNNQKKPSRFLPTVFFSFAAIVGIAYLILGDITPALSAIMTGLVFGAFSMQSSMNKKLGFQEH